MSRCGRACASWGCTVLLVPERFGGSGLGVLDAAVAAEALGAAVAPVPFIGLAMATLAVLWAGTPAQQDEWLPRIADSEALFGVGFAGLAGQTGEATATLADGRLTGRITAALDCGMCSHLLVVLDDGRMAIVSADEVRMTPRRSLDRTRPVTDLAFDAAPAELLSAGERAAGGRAARAGCRAGAGGRRTRWGRRRPCLTVRSRSPRSGCSSAG